MNIGWPTVFRDEMSTSLSKDVFEDKIAKIMHWQVSTWTHEVSISNSGWRTCEKLRVKLVTVLSSTNCGCMEDIKENFQLQDCYVHFKQLMACREVTGNWRIENVIWILRTVIWAVVTSCSYVENDERCEGERFIKIKAYRLHRD